MDDKSHASFEAALSEGVRVCVYACACVAEHVVSDRWMCAPFQDLGPSANTVAGGGCLVYVKRTTADDALTVPLLETGRAPATSARDWRPG